ncbi:MAG: hypothetical protein S4CHLAM37_02290 [Chlamydiia bacterium]|nr:hypothetical protein [Chlamydiia bacterium]
MKNSFLSKFVKLLNKEVCHEEKPEKTSHPITSYKALPAYTNNPIAKKPANVAAKSLKPQETVLSEGVLVKGELHFEKLLRINGSFEGNLKASGKLILGVKGKVQGDVDLEEAEVHGKILGNITVNHLVIGPHAEVMGNIHAQTLTLHKGAKFSGRLEIDPEPTSNSIYQDEEESSYQYSM